MVINDRRTGRFRRYEMVVAHDTFMSSWGPAKAEGKHSYCAWAAAPGAIEAVKAWVKARPEMKRVRIVSSDFEPPKTCCHFSIYEADESHPAFEEFADLMVDWTSAMG